MGLQIFGYTTIGISENFNQTDTIYAEQATAPVDGVIKYFTIYTARNGANLKAKIALYDNSLNYIGESLEKVISNTSAAWILFPVSSVIKVVAGQNYYICAFMDGDGIAGHGNDAWNDDSFPTPGTNNYFYNNSSYTYPTFPASVTLFPLDDGFQTDISLYATYGPNTFVPNNLRPRIFAPGRAR